MRGLAQEGGGIGPARGKSALPAAGAKAGRLVHKCGAVGGVAGRRGRHFLITSIFCAMEEARSSCEGVMGSFPGWEIEGPGLKEAGKALGG